MTHDDDDERVVAVLPRQAILAALAERVPDGPEGCALAVFRRVCGAAACGHLDDGLEGLMLVVELSAPDTVARVGYFLDATGERVHRWELHHSDGQLEQGALPHELHLEVALRMLGAWAKVKKRD